MSIVRQYKLKIKIEDFGLCMALEGFLKSLRPRSRGAVIYFLRYSLWKFLQFET
jgi:hypothetical protein